MDRFEDQDAPARRGRAAPRSTWRARGTPGPGRPPTGTRGRSRRRTRPPPPRRGWRARLPARSVRARTSRARPTRPLQPRRWPARSRSRRPARGPRSSASQRVMRPVPQPTSAMRRPVDVAEGARDELALALVPEHVERVGRPERPRHAAPRRGARVPVRRDAVHRVAREPLAEELPDAGGPGSVRVIRVSGVPCGQAIASARFSSAASSTVSMPIRPSAASARAVASSRDTPSASA